MAKCVFVQTAAGVVTCTVCGRVVKTRNPPDKCHALCLERPYTKPARKPCNCGNKSKPTSN